MIVSPRLPPSGKEETWMAQEQLEAVHAAGGGQSKLATCVGFNTGGCHMTSPPPGQRNDDDNDEDGEVLWHTYM